MAEMYTSDGASVAKQPTSKTIPLSNVLQNTRITFPFIADVLYTQHIPANTNVKEGELLWFLNRSAPEADGCICCRWEDPQTVFEIRGDWGVQLRLKNHWISTRSRLSSRSVGPTMSVHTVVNLAKPKEPIFAVPADVNENRYAFLKRHTGSGGDAGWRGRIVIHGKAEEQGYLVKGATRNFVIPKDFNEHFLFDERPKERSTVFKNAADVLNAGCLERLRVTIPINNTNAIDPVNVGDILELHNDGHTENRIDHHTGDEVQVAVFKRFETRRRSSSQTMIVHIPLLARCDFMRIEKDWSTLQECTSSGNTFPAHKVQFCNTSASETHSIDHVILQEENPMTILGVVSFAVAHISLHLNDPSVPAFQASQTIPEYYDFNVTPASQIPLDPCHLDIDNFRRPRRVIHVLNPNQFKTLQRRLDTENAKQNQNVAAAQQQQEPGVDSDGELPPYMNIPIPFLQQQPQVTISNGQDESDNNNNSSQDIRHDYANLPGEEGGGGDQIPTVGTHQFTLPSNTTPSYGTPPYPVGKNLGYINTPKQMSFEDMDDVFDTPPPMPAKKRSYSEPNVLDVKPDTTKQYYEHDNQRSQSTDSQLLPTQMVKSRSPPKHQPPQIAPPSSTPPSNKPRQLLSPIKPKPPNTASKPSKKPGPPVAAKPAGGKTTGKPGAKPTTKPTAKPTANVLNLKQQISFQLKAGGMDKTRMVKESPATTYVEANNNEKQMAVSVASSTGSHPVAQPRRALSPPNPPTHATRGPRHPIGGVSIMPGVISSHFAGKNPVGNPIRPARVAPSRPLPPGPRPVDNNEDHDSSDDDANDYQDIDMDADDYERLDDYTSQTPIANPPRLPPMDTHPVMVTSQTPIANPPRLPPMNTHPVMVRGGPVARPRRK